MTGEKTSTLPPVRVEAALKERLARYAEIQERAISWVIRKAIEEYLNRHEEGLFVQDPDRKA
ncbi:ribbon-helix-helix protein, CopG family [Streptosporangiaceae bacterium NEAU-GS5]|nr:ribbon-helix-helix protein, CopG family [Streptosporangiaceae bacterium NEAU-GS5]